MTKNAVMMKAYEKAVGNGTFKGIKLLTRAMIVEMTMKAYLQTRYAGITAREISEFIEEQAA